MKKNIIEKRYAIKKTVINFKKGIAKLDKKLQAEDNKIIKNLQQLKAILANVKIERKTIYANAQLIELCEKITESKVSRMKLIKDIQNMMEMYVEWGKIITTLIGK